MGNLVSGLILTLLISACSTPQRSTASYGHTPTGQFIWPLKSKKVTQHFKLSSFNYHDGIDMPAPTGTPIKAVESGRVVYSGRKFNGYGKMVLIEHAKGVATLYAHCNKIFVKDGSYVEKGQKIAEVGRTGRASAPHLHFEVRINKKPVDPMEFLP